MAVCVAGHCNAQNGINPILDSNKGKIETVLFSIFEIDPLECESYEKLRTNKILEFLLKEKVNVCFIPHVNFCKKIWAVNGELKICESIRDNDAVRIARNSLDVLTDGLRPKKELRNWLLNNSLIAGDFRTEFFTDSGASIGEFDMDAFVSELSTELAVRPNSVEPVFDAAKGTFDFYRIKTEQLPGMLPEQINEVKLIPITDKVKLSKVERRLESSELSNLLTEFNIRSSNYYTALQSAVGNKILSTVNELGSNYNNTLSGISLFPHLTDECQRRPSEDANDLERQLGRWMQDKFHVRVNQDQSYELGLVFGSSEDFKLKEWLKTGKDCFRGRSPQQPDPLSDVQGGNMFVLEDLVFIGADELTRYEKNRVARTRIGATDSEKHNIGYAVSKSVYGRTFNDQKVIWVGSNRPHFSQRLPDSSSYQPFYHIDICFHPLGIIDSVCYILVADPELYPSSTLSGGDTELIDSVNKWICEMKTNVGAQMKSHVDSIAWIKIPLALDYNEDYPKKPYPSNKPKLSCVTSPINGFSERASDKFTFWISVLINKDLEDSGFNDRVLKAFAEQEKLIVVKEVKEYGGSSGYGDQDGLHCKLKVVSRK